MQVVLTTSAVDNDRASYHVCDVYQHENLIDLVRLLIQHGADVNARDAGFRQTPLFLSVLELQKRQPDGDRTAFCRKWG